MSEPLEPTQRKQLREGVRLSAISIGWTIVSSGTTTVIGITQKSLVLVAFGLTGLLDAAGSTGLVLHFRHALKHERISASQERLVFLIVTTGLILVALFTGVEGVRRLIEGERRALRRCRCRHRRCVVCRAGPACEKQKQSRQRHTQFSVDRGLVAVGNRRTSRIGDGRRRNTWLSWIVVGRSACRLRRGRRSTERGCDLAHQRLTPKLAAPFNALVGTPRRGIRDLGCQLRAWGRRTQPISAKRPDRLT